MSGTNVMKMRHLG